MSASFLSTLLIKTIGFKLSANAFENKTGSGSTLLLRQQAIKSLQPFAKSFNFAAKVGVAWCVYNINLMVFVGNTGVFCKNGNSIFLFQGRWNPLRGLLLCQNLRFQIVVIIYQLMLFYRGQRVQELQRF
jgi:hypothetical protein